MIISYSCPSLSFHFLVSSCGVDDVFEQAGAGEGFIFKSGLNISYIDY